MAKISKILQQKLSILTNAPDEFLSSVEKTQIKLLREVESLMDKLQFEGDKLKVTQKNFSIIEQIDERLRLTFNRSEYIKGMESFTSKFKDLEKLNIKYFTKEFKVKIGDIVKTVIKNARSQATELLMGQSAMDAALFNPIKEALVQAVTSQSSWGDLVTNIRNIAIGTDKFEGKLLKYAKQIASDTLNTADRSVSASVIAELGAEFCQYVGNEKDTTRCFCLERYGKFYHVEEVKAWGRGDLSEAVPGGSECDIGKGAWAGMFKGTNESTIFIWAGGYNCRHSIVLRSAASVPTTVLQRAIDAGYYKPSKKEKEALGLD